MMRRPARLLRSGLLWRGMMIAALMAILLTLLWNQRRNLLEQEAAFGYAILDNAWAISELLNETKNLSARLNGHVAGRDTLEGVQLSFELLWSRIVALQFRDRIDFDDLAELEADYRTMLERHEPDIFASKPLTRETAFDIVRELESLAQRTRRLWSQEFNQDRRQFLGRVSGEVLTPADQIDEIMALLVFACLLYLGIELVLSHRALQREQALTDEARGASEMKSTFLANMSHEVRTPLAGIIGAADVLSEADLDPDQRLLVETVSHSAEHLLGVVNQVLDLSKIEAGKVDLEEGCVDLTALARIVVAMFRKSATDKGVEIGFRIDDTLPRLVRGDPLRMRQVLANLVSNAVKFTDRGEVVVELKGGSGPDDAPRLSIRVIDTGIGISREAQDRVFEAFTQSDVSDTRRFGGTGLGLTIARHLVQLMGGELTLASRPGEGTQARLDLPLRPLSGECCLQDCCEDTPDTTGPPTIRVLVVDDNATNRLLLARMLRDFVTGLDEAVDGVEAVDLWRERRPDLILMDIQMPRMTGVEAALAIRAAEAGEGRPPVPIYSLSANAMPHQVAVYTAAGMNGHLPKPFRKADIAEVIARHASVARHPAPEAPQPGLRSAQPAKTFSSATTM